MTRVATGNIFSLSRFYLYLWFIYDKKIYLDLLFTRDRGADGSFLFTFQ